MDDSAEDYALALQLQDQFDREAAEADAAMLKAETKPTILGDNMDSHRMSLVDERWEYLDPNPDIRALFLNFSDKYFWGKLEGIEVKWSPRMTLCAGLCVYEGMGGLCSVRLSTPLLKLRPRKDLIETLLHEMIHAYLFVTQNNKDHDAHGPEFHKHMYRLNKLTGTNITVYHTFHDEVESYRQHWWKCDGPCQNRPPYFGFVRRAMNRAPAPTDSWWSDHQRTCGGIYHKVKEPEGYGDKKKGGDKKREGKQLEKPKGNMDIRMFGGTGLTVGNGSRNNKQLAPSTITALPVVDDEAPTPPKVDDGPSWKPAVIQPKLLSEVGNKLVSPSTTLFPGSGKTLGGALKSKRTNPAKIVRRIPGLGIIKCDRPVSQESGTVTPQNSEDASRSGEETQESKLATTSGMPVFMKSLSECSQPKSVDSSSSVQSISDENRGPAKLTSDTCTLPLAAKHKTVDPDLVLLSSDSEDELFLPLRKKVRKQRRSSSSGSVASYKDSPHFSPNIPVGHSQKIPGFTSVANPRWRPRKLEGWHPEPQKNPTGKWNAERLVGGVTAADRNKRAVYVSSSESEGDFDDRQTLKSVVMNEQKASEQDSDIELDNEVEAKVSKLSESNFVSLPRQDSPLKDPCPSPGGSDIQCEGYVVPSLGEDGTSMCTCPVCGTRVPQHAINQHLDVCLQQ